jgi:hypothetical protein
MAARRLRQFPLGLQPILQIMARLAAVLKKDFTGSPTDLFLGRTILFHTPFLLLVVWLGTLTVSGYPAEEHTRPTCIRLAGESATDGNIRVPKTVANSLSPKMV